MSDSLEPDLVGGRGCARFGRRLPGDGYHHGESLECPGCGSVYIAVASEAPVSTEEEARCTACRTVMTHWPLVVRFELIETADEAADPTSEH